MNDNDALALVEWFMDVDGDAYTFTIDQEPDTREFSPEQIFEAARITQCWIVSRVALLWEAARVSPSAVRVSVRVDMHDVDGADH